MPNNSEGPITVFDTSVASINLALAQVLERLDMRAGLRGPGTIYDRTEVGGPVQQTEAVRLMDLPSEQPSNPLYHILSARPMGPAVRPAALTDNTGGIVSNTLAAVGGITVLTDNSGGTANDTIAAIPDPADAPASADALRDDLVANTLPPLRDAVADLAAKVNALIADLDDTRNALASLASKVNTIMVQVAEAGVLL